MNWFTDFTKNNQPKNPSHGSSNGGGSAPAAVQSANGQPANSQAANITNPQQGNGQNPNQNQQQNSGNAHPLDEFASLFTPKEDTKNNQQQQAPGYDGFLGQWDGKVVSERAAQLDFTRGIDPQIMESAMKGDQAAFAQVMNHTARQAFMAAAQAGHGFADRAVKTGLDKFGGSLDDRIRDYGVRTQNVATDHPILSHQAMQPMVDAVKMMIAQNDPKLNPQQVAEMTARYFDTIGGAYNQNIQKETNQQSQPAAKDWLADFGLPPLPQRGQGQ